MKKDLVIVGGGPAGLTAAIYAARGGLDVAVLEHQFVGGQVATTSVMGNYPGFAEEVEGAVLAAQMRQQTVNQGVQIVTDQAVQMRLTENPKVIVGMQDQYEAQCVVLAMGAYARKLGVPGEERLTGSGVSYCATCDGAFFRNKSVVMVGGGNSAVEDAIYLARLCEKVWVVHRRDTFRAQSVLVDELCALDNVELVLESTVQEILGDFSVSGVIVEHTSSGERREIAANGIFIAIGRQPQTELLHGQVELDGEGYILSDESCKTNLSRVFCAGDIRRKALRQVVTACADGAIAGENAIAAAGEKK